MGLSGKIDNSIRIIRIEYFCHRFSITDIRIDKMIVRKVFHILQIFQITGIRKLVQIDNLDGIAVLFNNMMNEI